MKEAKRLVDKSPENAVICDSAIPTEITSVTQRDCVTYVSHVTSPSHSDIHCLTASQWVQNGILAQSHVLLECE